MKPTTLTRILSQALTSTLVFTLAFPSALLASQSAPEAQPGVTTTDFGSTAPTKATIPVIPTTTTSATGSGTVNTEPFDLSLLNQPGTGTTSGSDPLAGELAAFNKLSCEEKCSTLESIYNGQAQDPVCGQNEQCRSCVAQGLSNNQTGRYCDSMKAGKKAGSSQGKAIALYGAGAVTCLAAGLAPPPARPPLTIACKGLTLASVAADMMGNKKMANLHEEANDYQKKSDGMMSKGNDALAAIFAFQFIKTAVKEGSKAALKGLSQMSGAMPFIAAGLLLMGMKSKKKDVNSYKEQHAKLCNSVNQMTDTLASSVNNCRSSSGSSLANSPLSFKKPEPFIFTPDEAETKAALGTGLIGEITKDDQKKLQEMYDNLDPKVQAALDRGEDPLSIASQHGLMSAGMKSEFEGILDRNRAEIMAALGGNADSAPLIAESSGSGNADGSGVTEDSFGGNRALSASVAGEGVSMQALGVSARTAAGGAYGSTCGQGHLHEGCDQSIFTIVSQQLTRKSKDESVAKLNPVLPLNQMRAGLKVESSRAPASAKPRTSNPAKVK